MKRKQIQIPIELFGTIFKYFETIPEEELTADERFIRSGLRTKIEATVRHELYTTYKTAPTEEEREKARKDFLETCHIPQDFRW